MFYYYSGNHLRFLADQLSDSLKSHLPDDPLKSQTILVPNRDTATWVQLYLSVKHGIAANYRFQMPAEWHWKQIREVYPDLPKVLPSDPEPMKWTLFSLIRDPDVLIRFTRLYNYISAQREEMRESAALNLCQQLASVYDQYLIYRPEMVLRWDEGKTGSGDEKWQAELWQLLTEKWSQSFEKPLSHHKAKLFDIAETEFQHRDVNSESPLFIFNPGLIPASTVRFLKVYAKKNSVFLFQNRVTERVDEDYNCSLLKSLADESLGVDSLYRQIIDEEKEMFPEFGSETLLSKVKNRLSKNIPDNAVNPTDCDSTIHIRSCHSPLRELETLHQFLLEQFEMDPSLKPDEILVVTPDLAPYEKLIDGVFGVAEEGIPSIPYRTPSSGKRESEQVINTFIDFLNLLTSRFQFDEVFDLFQSKHILEKFNLTESDAAKVKTWLEENYVIWGVDENHRKEWGQPDQRTQTWKQAIQRIWTGDLIGGHDDSALGIERYEGVTSISDRERWAIFSKYFGFLTDCMKEVKNPKSGDQWYDTLSRWTSNLFSDDVMSAGPGQGLGFGIDSLREQIRNSSMRGKFSFRILQSELKRILKKSRGQSTRFTDGITFSSMVPVRGLPFKIIALIGLNEASFPRKQNVPDFDLMNLNPRISERDRKKEDKALFLESVMAAGKIHYCSYIGQSKVDNEKLPPSPIVSEWIDYLSQITGKEQEKWVRYEAISGFSPNAFENRNYYSSRYHSAMAAALADSADRPTGLQFSGREDEEIKLNVVELNDLIRFFTKHPDWFLGNRFDVHPRDLHEERDEFSLNNLEKHQLFVQIFSWRLSGVDSDDILPVVLDSGVVPTGWGGRKFTKDLIGFADTALDVLRELNIEPEVSYVDVDINLNTINLSGTIESFSNDGLVQLTSSSMRGDNLFKAWLNHLVIQVDECENRKESRFICELKKGEPKVVTFRAVDEPGKLLDNYLKEFLGFSSGPMKFFPNVVQEFLDNNPEVKYEKAYSSAKSRFEGGGFNPFAERDKLSVKLLYGPHFEFSDDLLDDTYLAWMNEMYNHMEVEK